MSIQFENTPCVVMPKLCLPLVRRWLAAVARSLGYECGALVYRFCSDEEILDSNRQFLGHDYYTDIITFDYSSGHRVSGDMLISLDTVRSNASMEGESYERELLRVIVHGLLHLCGINDKGPGEREIMERHEDAALDLYLKMSAKEIK